MTKGAAMKRRRNGISADVQYVGLPGLSDECQNAVVRLVQYNDRIMHAKILTSSNNHGLLITVHPGDYVAVKAGFTSGYSGQGPRCFSQVLGLLKAFNIEIEEYEVETVVLERLNASSLTNGDIQALETAHRSPASQISDYIWEEHWEVNHWKLWRDFRPVIPYAIIDKRIIDLAISFWESADSNLLKGYRRLEDIVRKRAGIDEHGKELFARAFLGKPPKLIWRGVQESERIGRANLITGTFQAYRNPRAHRELEGGNHLPEFLLLNQLFLLEAEAVEYVAEEHSAAV